MPGSGDLWEHMRLVDLARRLRADLDALEGGRPEVEGVADAVGRFIALLLGDADPEASAILRGSPAPRRREPGPLTVRLAEARRARG